MIPAPCAASTFARFTAASADRQTLSRYHESEERLITPMRAGSELKAKCRFPIENSFTRAAEAPALASKRAASFSSVSINDKSLFGLKQTPAFSPSYGLF